MNANPTQLKDKISGHRSLVHIFGWFVVGGVFLEVVLAALNPDPWLIKIWPVVANAFVVIGVYGEIHFSGKATKLEDNLQRESEENIALANERAAAANLELAKLQVQLSPRALTKEQYDELQALKGRISAVNITSTSNFEATRFAAQIAQTLVDAGIDVRICAQRIAMVWTEIYVVIPKPILDFSKDPLYVAFKNAGLSVGCGDRSHVPMADLPEDVPVIMIGEKAPPSALPSYVFTLPSKTAE